MCSPTWAAEADEADTKGTRTHTYAQGYGRIHTHKDTDAYIRTRVDEYAGSRRRKVTCQRLITMVTATWRQKGTGRWTRTKADRVPKRHGYKQAGRENWSRERVTRRKPEKHTEAVRQTERHTDVQTGRHTHTDGRTDKHTV